MSGASFIIPTYFTAVDKISATMKGMGNSVENFAERTSHGVDRAERAFHKMTPHLSHAAKELFEFASAAAIAAAGVELIHFSFESINKFEEAMANLSASTGLSGAALSAYKQEIIGVAKESGKSAIDVANVFDIVAKANPDLINNAEAIGKISSASILMAKASGMELAPATESVTDAMTKMNMKADEAAGFVDTLASASLAGKYKMGELADGLTKFTATSKILGMSLVEDASLLQLSSTFRKAGEGASESGDHISKFLMKMEDLNKPTKEMSALLKHAGVSAKLLSSPTSTLTDKLNELQKIANNGALLDKMFGARQSEYVKGLLQHAGGLQTIIEKTAEKGTAEEMAAKREATLEESIKRLSNAWVNMLVSSDGATGGITMFQKAIDWLTRNLDTVVTVGVSVMAFFGAWWALMKVVRIALLAYNIGLGIYNALTGTATVYTEAQTIASGAQAVATGVMTAAQWSLNAAMDANPIGLVILAVAALAAGIMYLKNQYDNLIESMANAKKAGAESAKKRLDENVNELMQKKHLSQQEAQTEALATQKIIAIRAYRAAAQMEANVKNKTNWYGAPTDELIQAHNLVLATQSAAMELTKKDVFTKPGETAGLLNPKAQAQQNLSSTINNNTNKKMTIDFKNMPKGVEVQGGDEAGDVIPKSTSTMK